MPDRTLVPEEVAERLGVSTNYLAQRRFVGDGPPYVKVGPKKVVYLEESLNSWLKSRERTSTAEQVPA